MNQEENRNLEINEAELEQVSGGNRSNLRYGRQCWECGAMLEWYDFENYIKICPVCKKKYNTSGSLGIEVLSSPMIGI